jgi:hypothetical protein
MSAEAPRPLALVLVAAADRRMVPALALLPQLAGCDARALHIVFDPDQAHELAQYWMDLPMTSLPLQMEEPDDGESITDAVRRVVEHELQSRPRITVIVPEMDLGRWWQALLHRSMGRAVAWQLARLRGVTTLVVPVPIELPTRSSAAGR